MRRAFGWMLAVVLSWACGGGAAFGGGPVVPITSTPQTVGDQVIFYYDTRAGFTTFITLRNTSDLEVTASILFYGPTFSTPFSQAVTLAGGAFTIIDVGALRGAGLPAQPGIAIATGVDLTGRAIVTRALTGNFTIANLATGSAFGTAAAARVAFGNGPDRPELGTVIDGEDNARLQAIEQDTALLAAYYDPASLAPVSSSGNQLIFVNFRDQFGPTYSAAISSTTWNVTTLRSNGTGVSQTMFTANGITVSDLASVGGTGVNGAAGSMQFVTNFFDNTTRLIYFTESLGTFGTGYLLPPLP